MEDDWKTQTHRVDSRQNWLHSACDFRHEACDFQPKRMRLIDRKIASSGHSSNIADVVQTGSILCNDSRGCMTSSILIVRT